MSKKETTISGFPPDKDTFEYWIVQARDGRNVAECWQNCYRIAKMSSMSEPQITTATPEYKLRCPECGQMSATLCAECRIYY